MKLRSTDLADLHYMMQVAGAVAREKVSEASVLRGAMYYAVEWSAQLQEYTVGKVSSWIVGFRSPTRPVPSDSFSETSYDVRVKLPSFISEGLKGGLDKLVDLAAPHGRTSRVNAVATALIYFGLAELNDQHSRDPESVRSFWRAHLDEEASMGIYADERRASRRQRRSAA